MATGLSNKLTGQIGEYLVCAELGRLGLIATSFTGNVPEYDLLVCDEGLKSLPIQVKSTRSSTWPSRADLWLNIEIDDAAKQQINHGRKEIANTDLIYVCVSLGETRGEDRLKADIQDACIRAYQEWMDPKDWKRPKNYKSLDNRYGTEHLANFEDNWQLIQERLNKSSHSSL